MMATKAKGAHLNRKEMQAWLNEEIRDVLKECDLRVRDATDFTTGYLTGKLTAEQANERFDAYYERWDDPLRGVYASSHQNEQSLLDAIDTNRKQQNTRTFVEKVSQPSPSHSLGPRRGGR
jgi:hypothetical protein